MGEAKEKVKARRDHADKIVQAFENWIEAVIADVGSPHIEDSVRRRELREDLITCLVTPPPR